MSEKKVAIAVVGVGRVGITHLDGIRTCANSATIAAVVDIDESKAKKTAEEFNTKYYTNLDACLNDPDIDAVVVCLAHNLHYPVVMESLKAGKHVLVEKPLATSIGHADEMIKLSREKELVLMVGMSRRHFFAFHEIKKRMAEEIGEPFNLLYTFACFFDENIAPQWWRSEEKTGGLSFSMLGSHSIDFTLWMFENKTPVRVFAEAKEINPMLEGYDEVTLLLKFDDGSIATNFLSINTRPSRHEGLIIGPKGSASFHQYGDHVGLIGTASTDLHINGELVMSGDQEPHIFAVQMQEFADAILENRESWVKLEQIRDQLRIIEAARKSVNIQKPVNL